MVRDLRWIRRQPHLFLQRTQQVHGDLAAFPVPGQPVLLVNAPELVGQVLRDGRTWTKDTVQYASLARVTGPGLLASAESDWLMRRRIAQPAFAHTGLDVIADAVRRATKSAMATLPSLPAVVDVDALAMQLTLDVVGATLFDDPLVSESEALVQATEAAAELVVQQGRSLLPLPTWLPSRRNQRMRSAVRELDLVAYRVIAARRARGVDPQAADLLGLLLQAGLPDSAVRDELVTMVIAGHETVASALCWTLMLLAEHPAYQQEVREEVHAAGQVGAMALRERLPWTSAVVDEALRLYPPGWVVSRRAQKRDGLAEVEVPAGTIAVVSPWVVHRTAPRWQAPEEFRPERFLGQRPSVRGDYLPFGLGPRQCIGRDFGLVELVVVLAEVLREHTVETVLPARPRANAFVTLRPDGGMPLRLTAA